ncbi:MAG: iron-containing alcohol dehydrogenase [Sphingomonadales bacterium]
MTLLNFATAGYIICAPGSVEQLGALVAQRDVGRVLLVCDPGIEALGRIDPALESLNAADKEGCVFSDVEADPSAATVEHAAQQARSVGAQAVIGFGGGSPMDVAKAAAMLLGSNQPLDALYGVDKASGPRLPLLLIPTTAGTGSEVTPIAILTIGAETKMGIVSPHLLPDVALLDPQLTKGLPPHITAATGIDAMVHAIEAFTSLHKKNPISDALAIKALSLLAKGVPAAYADGANLEARGDALLGASLAGMAFANAPVAAVHALAYPIGARFHVPHVLRFNLSVADALNAELAPLLCSADEVSQAPSAAAALVNKLEQLCDSMCVPRRLRYVVIGEDALPKLADDAMEQTRLLINNPKQVTSADALAIYQAAF